MQDGLRGLTALNAMDFMHCQGQGACSSLALSCSPPVHRCTRAGMRSAFLVHSGLHVAFCCYCSFACLLWVVRDLGEHAGKGYFLILYY